ncbi:hypothetical protein ACM6Q7_04520 [Peribacillus butanolivorans]|uniref:hypothetical protein n=1 Tax=Peribacillus butanolivorans TaxID=421767 RepID=UPI0039FCEBAE
MSNSNVEDIEEMIMFFKKDSKINKNSVNTAFQLPKQLSYRSTATVSGTKKD